MANGALQLFKSLNKDIIGQDNWVGPLVGGTTGLKLAGSAAVMILYGVVIVC